MKKKLFHIASFCLSIVALAFSSLAQPVNQHRLDSLHVLLKGKNGMDRFEPIVQIALEYWDDDKLTSLRILKMADSMAWHYGDSVAIVRSGRKVGQLLQETGQLKEAQQLLLRILPLSERRPENERDLLVIYNTLANVYNTEDLWDKALFFYFKSLEIRKRREGRGDKNEIGIALANIGLLYYKLTNYDKAIEYYLKALVIKERMMSTYDLDRLFINLSLCYVVKKQFANAKKYLKQALNTCGNDCPRAIQVELGFTKGYIYYNEDHLVESENEFLKSYDLALQSDNKRFQLENVILLANVYLKQQNFNDANTYLKKGEELCEDSKFNHLKLDLWKCDIEFYSHFNEYNNVTKYQSKYIQLRDSLYSENLTQNLMAIQTEYEQRDEKTKIESQNRALALKEEAIEKQSILAIVAGVAVVLLGLLVFVLFRTNQKKKLVNDILEQKVEERTLELTNSYQLIQKAYNDQTLFVNHALVEMKMPLATLMQLCSSKSKVIQHERKYISRLNETTEELTNMMEKFRKTVER